MAQENLQGFGIEPITNGNRNDIGIIRYYPYSCCLVERITPSVGRIIIENAHQHSFEEGYHIEDYCKAVAFKIGDSEKVELHEISSNEVYAIGRNIPHQVIIAKKSLYSVTPGTRESFVNGTAPVDCNIIKEAEKEGLLKKIDWLQKSKRFMNEIQAHIK